MHYSDPPPTRCDRLIRRIEELLIVVVLAIVGAYAIFAMFYTGFCIVEWLTQ
jgi:hypothetical protein